MAAERLIKEFNKRHVIITATLLLFIITGSDYDYIKAPIIILCSIPLLFPEFQLSKPVWLGVLLILILAHIPYFFEIDNFRFIFMYWCLAILASTFSDDFDCSLKLNARLMIGVIFGLAAINKLFSGDYLSGAFFQFSALTDNRFTRFLEAVRLLPHSEARYNWDTFMYMINDAEMPFQTNLKSTGSLNAAAQIFTCLVLTVESGIAVLFLLPKKIRITTYRDYLLYAFIGVTYSIANVVGFGSIVCILGLAQCDTKRKSFVYIFLLLLMHIYRLGIYKFINALF
jgi:hypothetical protein